ncbi:hypothetical protein GCM10009733_077150 [Nonomuraea maheshkhaliensis]|uniref:Uncharacterized protein n=1 Tax=Nonomuraea maheshkhaliensis TaxID=419590 RepID=A0ABN2GAV1_9ACTN
MNWPAEGAGADAPPVPLAQEVSASASDTDSTDQRTSGVLMGGFASTLIKRGIKHADDGHVAPGQCGNVHTSENVPISQKKRQPLLSLRFLVVKEVRRCGTPAERPTPPAPRSIPHTREGPAGKSGRPLIGQAPQGQGGTGALLVVGSC